MGLSAATFDIETTNLNADFGVVLCGVVLPHDSRARPIVFRADQINKRWAQCRSDDSGVVRAITAELSKYDVLIAHNGARFDIPYLKTR